MYQNNACRATETLGWSTYRGTSCPLRLSIFHKRCRNSVHVIAFYKKNGLTTTCSFKASGCVVILLVRLHSYCFQLSRFYIMSSKVGRWTVCRIDAVVAYLKAVVMTGRRKFQPGTSRRECYCDVIVNKSTPLVVPLLFSPISQQKAAVMLRPICLPSAPPDVASEQTW